MRILIASDTYYPHVNGASYFTQRLAHYLQKAGHTVAVVAPGQKCANTHTTEKGVPLYGIWSLPVPFYKGFRFCIPLLIYPQIKKIIEEFKPDIVHLQMHFSVSQTMERVARSKKIPVVATNHFMPENLVHYLHLPKPVTERINYVAWRDCRRVLKHVLAVTAPTRTAADLTEVHLPMKVQAISCGIDLERFKPQNEGAYLQKRYKIPKKPVLLYVGRLDREKNLDFILHAMAKAVKKVDFHFVIAGTGAERTRLEKIRKEENLEQHVTFAGFVPDEDLPNLYAVADVFVIAGIAELQSIVTMEAMATGLPVLAVRAVALPELVKDSENGFLFEQGDEKTLSLKMVTLFSDEKLRRQMGAASLKIIASHDINKTIVAFETLYKQAINHEKARPQI
jgi:glycosyltransferase involved in cell wall biosynthesis